MIYDYACDACVTAREVRHPMTESPEVLCLECGCTMHRLILGPIYTHKDRAFTFTTQHIRPGTEIRSKGQWNRFLKVHKLTDDVGPKEKLNIVNSGLPARKRQERWDRTRQRIRPVIEQAVAGR